MKLCLLLSVDSVSYTISFPVRLEIMSETEKKYGRLKKTMCDECRIMNFFVPL